MSWADWMAENIARALITYSIETARWQEVKRRYGYLLRNMREARRVKTRGAWQMSRACVLELEPVEVMSKRLLVMIIHSLG